MKINPALSKCRLTDPQRRAERDVYQALEASEVPGRALYEAKVTKKAAQVDFLVWAENIATFAVQLKGGTYVLDKGELSLVTHHGRELQDGLLGDVWDSAMAIPKFLKPLLHRGTYVVPVLALPDMEQDEAIRDMAARRSVETLFGMSDWVEHLLDLADGHPIRYRPTRQTINEEVEQVMPELASMPAPTAGSTPPQVIIHRVDQLHIHVGPEGVETLGLPDLTADG